MKISEVFVKRSKHFKNPASACYYEKYVIRDFIRYLGKDSNINKIDGDTINNYIDLIERSRGERAAYRHCCTLSEVFNYAFNKRIINQNPIVYIIRPRKVKFDFNLIPPHRLATIFKVFNENTLKDTRNKVVLGLYVFCGLRAREIINIEVDDVDVANETIYIKGSKNLVNRCIPIASPLTEWIKEYLGLRSKSNSKYFMIVGSPFGNKISTVVLKRLYAHVRKQTGIQITSNILRHLFSSYLYKEKVNIAHIKSLMGHTNIEMTASYIKVGHQEIKHALTRNPLLRRYKNEQ